MAKGTVTVFPTTINNFEIEIGGQWYRFPFTGDVEVSPNPAPVQEVVTGQGIGAVVGKQRLPGVSIALPSYAPHLWLMKQVEALRKKGAINSFRWTRPGETIGAESPAGKTAAIDGGTGAVTFAGDDHQVQFSKERYGVGLVLKIGASRFIVDTVSEAGAITVVKDDGSRTADADDVAAAVYSVELPGLRQAFAAQILASPALGWTAPADAQLNSGMQLQPVSEPDEWEIVAP